MSAFGRPLEVPDITPHKSTTPLAAPLSSSLADIYHVSSRLPAAAADSLPMSILAQVKPDGQVRTPFLNQKRQERRKEPEIERGTEDIDVRDADCVARELLCRTPDQQDEKDFEG